MARLIDKDALVAEIERLKNTSLEYGYNTMQKVLADSGKDLSLGQLQYFLDTLEVKEVDLDFQRFAKEMDTVFNLPSSETKNTEEEPLNWEYAIAKHFFELGLKAQHNNWKVVDNTNHPQEDRTKIYCVFTKQRYILAKVISHPQDDDLLQWKCTEFPNHRYDMCEGDKYMQIV